MNTKLVIFPTPVLLAVAVAAFYIVPTFLELSLIQRPGLWLASVLVGDLSGCIGIFVALKKRRLAVLLYLGLTALECSLYASRILSAHLLVFLMDIVPTAIMMGAMLRPRAQLTTSRT